MCLYIFIQKVYLNKPQLMFIQISFYKNLSNYFYKFSYYVSSPIISSYYNLSKNSYEKFIYVPYSKKKFIKRVLNNS